MSRGNRRKRRCTACGRAVRGHIGPVGVGKCQLDLLGDLGDEGEFSGGEGSATEGPLDRQHAPRNSGPAAADNRGLPGSVGSALCAFPDASGGMGPPRRSTGLFGGRSAWEAGASPVVSSARRRLSRSKSPIRPRLLADGPPGPGACAPPFDHRRERSCPPAVSSPAPPAAGARPRVAWDAQWDYHDRRDYVYAGGDCQRPGFAPPSPPRAAQAPGEYLPRYGASARTHLEYVPPGYDDVATPFAGAHSRASLHDYRPPSHYFDARLSFPGDHDSGTYSAPPGTEHVDRRHRQLALSGECIDLSDMLPRVSNSDQEELKSYVDDSGCVSFKSSRSKRVINTSFKWIEAWTIYSLIMCSVYGLRLFHEMAAYQMFVLSLFAKYKLPFVLMYDVRHRQSIGARRDLNFNALDYPLYITTFDCNALKPTSRCTRCSSLDHTTDLCPFRAPGQAGDLPNRQRRGNDRHGDRQSDRQSDKSEVCFQFNEGRCRGGSRCRRRHVCIGCGGPEGIHACTKCKPPPKSQSGPGTKN